MNFIISTKHRPSLTRSILSLISIAALNIPLAPLLWIFTEHNSIQWMSSDRRVPSATVQTVRLRVHSLTRELIRQWVQSGKGSTRPPGGLENRHAIPEGTGHHPIPPLTIHNRVPEHVCSQSSSVYRDILCGPFLFSSAPATTPSRLVTGISIAALGV